MLKDSIEDLDNGLNSLSSRENKKNFFQSTASVLLIIVILGLILTGFLSGAQNAQYFISNTIVGKEPTLRFSTSSDHILVQTGNTELGGELKLIAENLLIYDISKGKKNVVSSAITNDAQAVAYITKDTKGLNLHILETKEMKNILPMVSLSSFSSITAPQVKSSAIKLCSWSSLEWSPSKDSILIYLCFEKKSVLVSIKVDEKQTKKLYTTTIGLSAQPRLGKWLDNNTILYTKGVRKEEALFQLNINTELEKSLYNLVR